MADFEVAHKITSDCEGGYVNDPKDAGGETIFGIARNIWGDLALWQDVDNYKKMAGDLSTKEGRKKLESLCLANPNFVEQKNAFYKKQFWDKCKGDEIKSQAVANNVYDFAVNAGVKQSVKILQRVLNIADDGIFGNGTLNALNDYLAGKTSAPSTGKGGEAELTSASQDRAGSAATNSAEAVKLNNDFCAMREQFYKDLVARKPQNEKFLNGWLSRVKRFYV